MGLSSSKIGPSASTSTPGSDHWQDDEGTATLWGNVPLDFSGPEPGGPSFHRGLLWTLREKGRSPTVESTFISKPLPRPPAREFRAEIKETITRHPHLFRIVTPIKISKFEELTKGHPNRPFVKSVLAGLREGFWPFANTNPTGSYPLTHDASSRHSPKSGEKYQFLKDQCNAEIAAERFSKPFGTALLPGQYSPPIYAVPKKEPHKFRLVVDHSASGYALNSMIPRDNISGTSFDGIKDLADSLIQFRREYGPSVLLCLFKSDVSSAYRNLPMHPLWQMKQIVTIDGQRHVDRCNSFGNRASQRLWVSFMALVTWIATSVRKLAHLKLYTDDCFSFELASSTEYYAPYKKKLPKKQAQLLRLWDELGVPHEEKKQVFGETLEILGFLVDPNAMTITIPKWKLDKLLSTIRRFCSPKSGRQTRRRFMQLAGSMSWALYVFPMLKPGLRALHKKIGTKKGPDDSEMYLNNTIKLELDWFAQHAERLGGVHVMESIAWEPSQANHVFFCDASPRGLSCFYKQGSTGFRAAAPLKSDISFLKALSICWAIHLADRRNLEGRVLIYTDNLDTVKIRYSY
ncbi:hypothetical protein AX14_000774 [Amanita brunnescens Koide BX004]|nr:hypothetical protein AX14_000774 [Amanita brunnescens Koide BX004]